MSNDLKKIGQCFAESVIYMLAAALAVGVLMIDIILLGNAVGEASLVEYTPEFLLLVTAFLYYQLAWRHKVMDLFSACLSANLTLCLMKLFMVFGFIPQSQWLSSLLPSPLV